MDRKKNNPTDLPKMSVEALESYAKQMEERYREVEDLELAEDDDAFEDWLAELEELESIMEEIQEMLEAKHV